MKIIAELENKLGQDSQVILQVGCSHEWQLKEILKAEFPHYEVKSAWRTLYHTQHGKEVETLRKVF